MHVNLVSELDDRADFSLQITINWVTSHSKVALGHPGESMSLYFGFLGEADVIETVSIVKKLVFSHLIEILGSRNILCGLQRLSVQVEHTVYHFLIRGLMPDVLVRLYHGGLVVHKVATSV